MKTRTISVVDNLEEAYKEGLVYIEERAHGKRRFITRVPFQITVGKRNYIYSEGEVVKI